eukprot:TRINITY_DN3540_c0_g2_i16.p1 TRINITY_DN3540_c0_g2~~TRINITY_DN3540_c0_g2_i16.p1  ORF type:complete len:185 (+),score=12.90 TRINITY_DN3540_c0_g2_i16:397-951(+)
MLKLALETNDWVMVSEWEGRRDTWTETSKVCNTELFMHVHLNLSHKVLDYFYENLNNGIFQPVRTGAQQDAIRVRLVCGSDLLQSFDQGPWSEEDVEKICRYGICCVERLGYETTEIMKKNPILKRHHEIGNVMVISPRTMNNISSSLVRFFFFFHLVVLSSFTTLDSWQSPCCIFSFVISPNV